MLTQRALNRATLTRQYLLERAPVRAIDAIEHLGGMQSQAPLAPYVGLWTRLRDFAPAELATLTEERQVVRLQLMRNTVHLVSKRDGLGWPALFTGLQAAELPPLPMTRSPSQWPGTWRPATSAGRSSIETIPTIFAPLFFFRPRAPS